MFKPRPTTVIGALLADAIASSAAPTTFDQGIDVTGFEKVAIECKATIANWTLDLWWFYPALQLWYKDAVVVGKVITFAAGTQSVFIVAPNGANRVYAQGTIAAGSHMFCGVTGCEQ